MNHFPPANIHLMTHDRQIGGEFRWRAENLHHRLITFPTLVDEVIKHNVYNLEAGRRLIERETRILID